MADFPRNHPSRGHFVSTFGAVHQSHSSQKTKKPLSQQRDKGNILCGTTLLAGQTRPATQVLPGNGGVRRGLLKFSPLLQGDVPRLLPSALHPNGGSLCVSEAGTSPFPRGFPYLPEYLICFFSCCQGEGVHFFNRRGGCYFLNDQKVTKESPGPPPMSAFAERALIGGLPRTPFTRDALPVYWAISSGGQNQDRPIFLAPGAQAPTKWKFGNIRAVRTPPTRAKPWQLVHPITAAPNR